MADMTTMATSFIETMARSFDEQLMELHDRAMQCHDVQDAVGVGTNIAITICRGHQITSEPVVNASLQELCRMVLRSLTRLRTRVNEFVQSGFEIKGMPEFDEAVVEMRLMLGALGDAIDPERSTPVGASDADSRPIPVSWYQEDHSKALGPFGK